MKTVIVEKAKLVEILKTNRDDHNEKYKIAFEGYSKKFIAKIEKMLAKAKAGTIPSRRYLDTLDKPENHAEDYDRVLEMLEMHVGDQIELQHGEFRCYVKDEWNWQDRFVRSFSSNTE